MVENHRSFALILDNVVGLFKTLFGYFLELWEWMTTPIRVHLTDTISNFEEYGIIGDFISIILKFIVGFLGDITVLSLMIGSGLTIYLGLQLYIWWQSVNGE